MLLREGASGQVSGPDQVIGIAEALHTYTTAGAWQDHAERWKGAVEPGMAADLCVLDGALLDRRGGLAPDPHDLTDPSVALTVVDGRIVYDYDAAQVSYRAAVAAAGQANWARIADPAQICSHC